MSREKDRMSLHKDYHLNGQLKEEGNYKNGEPQGKWTWWYENGQKWEERTYQNGKLDGELIRWYESGQKKTKGSFQDGEKVGKCYLTFNEVTNPKRKGSIDYLEINRDVFKPGYGAFCLSDSRRQTITLDLENQWVNFVQKVNRHLV